MARAGNTYRAARRNRIRSLGRLCEWKVRSAPSQRRQVMSGDTRRDLLGRMALTNPLGLMRIARGKYFPRGAYS